MIVVNKGRIVFEEYPGMRATDLHVLMLVATAFDCGNVLYGKVIIGILFGD